VFTTALVLGAIEFLYFSRTTFFLKGIIVNMNFTEWSVEHWQQRLTLLRSS